MPCRCFGAGCALLIVLSEVADTARVSNDAVLYDGLAFQLQGTNEDIVLYCDPADAEKREPHRDMKLRGFNFELNNARVGYKHSYATDIIRADECIVGGEALSLQGEGQKLRGPLGL